MKEFNYEDGVRIVVSEDAAASVSITTIEGVLQFNEADKPRFKNEDTRETVVEYSGMATDKNEERSWARAYFEEGSASPAHYHAEREEIYYIVGGRGLVVIDGEEHVLEAGQSITIPKGSVHQVINNGAESFDLVVKCSPSWVYQDHNIVEEAPRPSMR